MAKSFRVGIGKRHRVYSKNVPIRLGGINIPNSDSDAGDKKNDCLIEAISDALLGAAALGGTEQIHELNTIPTSDVGELLREAERMVHYDGYEIVNIDAAISTSLNAISSYCNRMRDHLAAHIFIKPEQINVKVNLHPDSDAEKQADKIECMAIASLSKR